MAEHRSPPGTVDLSANALSALAQEVGLDLAASTSVGETPSWQVYREWVAAGYAAGMSYLERPDASRGRQDPRHVYPSAKSVLVVAASYAGARQAGLPPLHGKVSRYVWGARDEDGRDYHDWVLSRLKRLIHRIEQHAGQVINARTYVDTGPVLERAWARQAGLGWIGKNSLLIHPQVGSYTFLGVALMDAQLPITPGDETEPRCGTCTRCIDACPTGAIVAPGVIDARRCLSYLTIEHRGPIPEEYRGAVGDRVFGCDTCQDVCPWNRRPLDAHQGEPVQKLATLDLREALTLDADGFRTRYRRTPIWRATPDGLARNAAIVLGNLGDAAAHPDLERAATGHRSAPVRDAAVWALQELARRNG